MARQYGVDYVDLNKVHKFIASSTEGIICLCGLTFFTRYHFHGFVPDRILKDEELCYCGQSQYNECHAEDFYQASW